MQPRPHGHYEGLRMEAPIPRRLVALILPAVFASLGSALAVTLARTTPANVCAFFYPKASTNWARRDGCSTEVTGGARRWACCVFSAHSDPWALGRARSS